MAVIRENIQASSAARDRFLTGMVMLDQERPGITAGDVFGFLQRNQIPLSMRGLDQDLSTYDLFVLWHVVAASIQMPPGNGAHGGPVFLPWHRMYLIRLEQELQRVLNDDTFGLPYWDWAADGELPEFSQWQTPLWTDTALGEARGAVRSGPLADIRVRLFLDGNRTLLSVTPRPIQRESALDNRIRTLPTRDDVRDALDEIDYDRFPWSLDTSGHRNRLEGWIEGPQLHNRVHVWIGGDMSPGSSPNDPAFFLNHCNVDRIWEAWMADKGRVYQPGENEGPAGHRVDDLMISLLGDPMRPSGVLDPAEWYSYDTLSVA